MNYSDHDIEYYGEVFRRLDECYQVCSAHHVTFELFMRAPAESERWIHNFSPTRRCWPAAARAPT
jgi:hypothetical protein